MLANGLNIVLGPMFIFGIGPFPELGVTGAAVATVIGRGTGMIYAAWSLFLRKGGRIEVHAHHWQFEPKLLWSLVKLSTTAVVQFLISTASWSGLVRVVAGFGSVAIAGYQVGLRVIIFVLLPAVGLANAAATLVGQNLGAGKPERAERSVWIAAAINAVLLGVASVVFYFFSHDVARIFSTDPHVLEYAADCLRIVAYGYALYGLGMVVETAFNGAGDTMTPRKSWSMVNLNFCLRASFVRLRETRSSSKIRIARGSGQYHGSGTPSMYQGKMPLEYASRKFSKVSGRPKATTSRER
jgi:putative MATE family efflux protein